MSRTVPYILPLYHFFDRLRQSDHPLGVGDYEQFLVALEYRLGLTVSSYTALLTTIGPASRDQDAEYPHARLLDLCRLLWLKPDQSSQLFEDLFYASWPLDLLQLNLPEDASPDKTQPQDHPEAARESSIPTPKDNPSPSLVEEPGAIYDSEATDSAGPLSVRISVSEYLPNKELAIRTHPNIELDNSKFLFTPNYFPLDKRKMVQNLRMLPSFRYSHAMKEIDIPATVSRTIAKGFFHDIVWARPRVSALSLTTLIDHQGSMVAFEPLSDMLKDGLAKIASSTYYFYNCPGEHLFLDKPHTRSEKLQRVLHECQYRSSAVIIISDAGAARGNKNSKRTLSTSTFLTQLRKCTKKIVWLNPMPRERWGGSSAEDIAGKVAMFEAGENGIKNAVDFLKGTTSTIIRSV